MHTASKSQSALTSQSRPQQRPARSIYTTPVALISLLMALMEAMEHCFRSTIMVRWQAMWQRLAAQGCACTAAAVLGLLALVTPSSALGAVLSVTGQGGAVPDNNAAGITFDITIPPNSGTIAPGGNNVTLSLIGFTHSFVFQLTFTLHHVGFGSAQFLLDKPLNSAALTCGNNFINGTYRFTSDATTTIQDICNGTRSSDIPPGDYIPTLPNDATDSEMSSFWNGQDVSGTWRLFIFRLRPNDCVECQLDLASGRYARRWLPGHL